MVGNQAFTPPNVAGDAAFVAVNSASQPIAWGTLGGVNDDRFDAVTRLADGGYLLAGFEAGSGKNRGFVVKLDEAFGLKWQRSFGEMANVSARFKSIVQLADGSILIAGDRDNDGWVVHLPDANNPGSAQPPYGVASNYQMKDPSVVSVGVPSIWGNALPGTSGHQGYTTVPINMNQMAAVPAP